LPQGERAHERAPRITLRTMRLRKPLRLLQKLRAQHQTLDLFGVALDLVGTVAETDVLDQRAAFQGFGCTLDLEILDQRHGIAVAQRIAVAVFRYVRHCNSLSRAQPVRRPRGSGRVAGPAAMRLSR